MYCIGVIRPCERPCGFVEPLFSAEGKNQKYFLCRTSENGTIASFEEFDGAYPVEICDSKNQYNALEYNVNDLAPIAFIYYTRNVPTLLIGAKSTICDFLSKAITHKAFVNKIPLEAKVKAAQYLGKEYLSLVQIKKIYFDYYEYLKTRNSKYAEMWKQVIRQTEGLSVTRPRNTSFLPEITPVFVYDFFTPDAHAIKTPLYAKLVSNAHTKTVTYNRTVPGLRKLTAKKLFSQSNDQITSLIVVAAKNESNNFAVNKISPVVKTIPFSREDRNTLKAEIVLNAVKNEIETPGIVWKKLDPAVSIDTTKKTTIFVVE